MIGLQETVNQQREHELNVEIMLLGIGDLPKIQTIEYSTTMIELLRA